MTWIGADTCEPPCPQKMAATKYLVSEVLA